MPLCIGGTVIDSGRYRIHKYTTVGNDTLVVTNSGNVEVLLVAGGGGGGKNGGGGGAGGLFYNATLALGVGNKIITVGAGGTINSGAGTYKSGANGADSVLDTTTATGGGGGGGSNGNFGNGNGTAGGSGGGGGFGLYNGVGGDADYISPRQGYDGGNGAAVAATGGAGGGGGAGAAGGNYHAGYHGGKGGNGLDTYSDLLIAANAGVDIAGVHWIAGGAGGGGEGGGTGGAYGNGGGGSGGSSGVGVAGTANTGGGGGGGGAFASIGAVGGSGIVIVRYIPSVSASKFNFFFMKPVKQLWDSVGGIYRPKNTGIVTI